MTLKQVGIAIVALAAASAGFFAARGYEQAQSAKQREANAMRHAAELSAAKSDAEAWASAIADAQGAAILRSFTAGLTPLLLAERQAAIDIAGASLLRLQGVQGLTVMRGDGKVLYASDTKLTVSDQGNEQTRWALSAVDFVSRPGMPPGVTEMALPVSDAGKTLAVVWLAYDTQGIRDTHRPAAFTDSSSSDAAVAADSATMPPEAEQPARR